MNPTLRILEIQIKVSAVRITMSSHLNAVWVSRRIGVGPCLTVYLLVLSITRFDRTSQSTELRYIISGAYLSNI